MAQETFDQRILGAGPGGYVAAIRAAQLGINTAVVEKENTLGGTCLNVGCIPSKALLYASEKFAEAKHGLKDLGVETGDVKLNLSTLLAHKENTVKKLTSGVEYLFKKNKVTWLKGLGALAGESRVTVTGADGKTQTVRAKNIVIATGSSPSSLPGVALDGKTVLTSTEALSFTEVPKELVVIGAGVIGLEMGSVWSRLGSKVTLLEYAPQILNGFDTELAQAAQRVFAKQGLTFVLNAKVSGVTVKGKKATVTYTDKSGAEQSLPADKVLVATGRRPHTGGLEAEKAGLKLDTQGRIEVDEHFRTNQPGVYAIGDVIRGPMLAHKAEDEGVAVAEIIHKGHGHVDYHAIPGIVYTWPEVACVGQTEEQLKAAGVAYNKGKFPFMANGRALSMKETDGFVKVLSHKETDKILGVHALGPAVGDLMAEATLAMSFDATAEDLFLTCHAHPTLSEVLKEAAMATGGRAIHS